MDAAADFSGEHKKKTKIKTQNYAAEQKLKRESKIPILDHVLLPSHDFYWVNFKCERPNGINNNITICTFTFARSHISGSIHRSSSCQKCFECKPNSTGANRRKEAIHLEPTEKLANKCFAK